MKEDPQDTTNERMRGVFESVLGQSLRKTCPSLFFLAVRRRSVEVDAVFRGATIPSTIGHSPRWRRDCVDCCSEGPGTVAG